MNQIRENLWITDISTVINTRFDADRVVSVCQDSAADNVGCDYRHYNMSDGTDDSYGGSVDYSMFESAVDTVVSSVSDGNKTVVHCHMGRSRSAAVTIAATAACDGSSYHSAYERVNYARRVDPDPLLIQYATQYIASHTEHGGVAR